MFVVDGRLPAQRDRHVVRLLWAYREPNGRVERKKKVL
jgi:hypothetical protein